MVSGLGLILSTGLLFPATARALSLGTVTVHSAAGQPLLATATVHADGGPVTVGAQRMAAIDDAGTTITARYEAASHLMILSSDLPVSASPLLVRISLQQDGVAFNGTYDLAPGGDPRRQVDALPDHVYAGQLAAAAGRSSETARQIPHPGQTYGPIAAGTTLMQIADRLAANSGGSRARFALALFQKNPHQFIDHDPRRLRTAAVLHIPDVVAVQLTDAGAADHLQRYLLGRAATPMPTEVTPTPQRVPAWERSLLSSLRTLYQRALTPSAMVSGRTLLLMTSTVLLMLLLRPGLSRAAATLRRRRWTRQQANPRPAGDDAAPGTATDAVARLQALLRHHPERDDIRLRLIERLSQCDDHGELLMHISILRERLSAQQFQQVRRIAQRAGVFDPRALGY